LGLTRLAFSARSAALLGSITRSKITSRICRRSISCGRRSRRTCETLVRAVS